MDKELLRNLLYFVLQKECGGENCEGQKGVASVIWNRASDIADIKGGAPQDYFEIVLKKPKQFSCLNGIKDYNSKNLEVNIHYHIEYLADSMIAGQFSPSGPWRYYYNPRLCSPIWAHHLTDIKAIGNHIFGK